MTTLRNLLSSTETTFLRGQRRTIKPTCWRASKAGFYPAALGRAVAGGSRTVPRGAGPEENGASLYGRDPTKGFAEAVAWPVAGDQAQRGGVCAM